MTNVNMKTVGIGAVLLVGLAGCAGAIPNTATLEDLGTIQNIINAGVEVETVAATMPDNGTATYTGQVLTTAPAEGGNGILAQMEMNADFDAGTVSGSVTDVNMFSDGVDGIDSQLLGGSLAIDGAITGDTLTAGLTGDLSGSIQGFGATFGTDLTMEGGFEALGGTDPNIVSGWVTGDVTVTMDVTGESVDTIGYTDGDMVFYGCTTDCAVLLDPGL